MFHDIGRQRSCLRSRRTIIPTRDSVLGHIIIGVQMLEERIAAMPGFPKKLEHELIHCILAHHGELEYGSPKVPETIEALFALRRQHGRKNEDVEEMLAADNTQAAGRGITGCLPEIFVRVITNDRKRNHIRARNQ